MNVNELADMLTQGAYLAVGLIVTLVMGRVGVKPLLKVVSKQMPVPPPPGVLSITWNAATTIPGKKTANWIGSIDGVVAFLSFRLGRLEILFAWLAFKVAAKWDSWSHIAKIPPRLEGVTDLDYLISRASWGARTYQRFVIGTFANVLAGGLGIGTYALLDKFQPFTVTLP